MNKKLIKELLTKVMPNADIPSSYGYIYDKEIKNLTLLVKIKGLKANMQDDEASFDSWAIALKYHLREYIETITIDWERGFSNGEDGILHYNLKSATTRLYDTEAKIICIVSKKGAQCIECHHKDI